MKKVSKGDREAVNELVYAPRTRDLLKVEWDEDVSFIRKMKGNRDEK